MIKRTYKREAITIPNLPSEVAVIVVEIKTILDDNYGKERDVDNDLGWYILIVGVTEDVETIKKLIDFEDVLPEYVDLKPGKLGNIPLAMQSAIWWFMSKGKDKIFL